MRSSQSRAGPTPGWLVGPRRETGTIPAAADAPVTMTADEAVMFGGIAAWHQNSAAPLPAANPCHQPGVLSLR